jgi:hypothetical protein
VVYAPTQWNCAQRIQDVRMYGIAQASLLLPTTSEPTHIAALTAAPHITYTNAAAATTTACLC